MSEPKPTPAEVLRELNRIKVLFQARTVALVLGVPHKDLPK